ncbi:DUF1643 domain-containing protein [Comamonas thiooxydans]|uniref:DUF1643 domain-containing protein n=1 Tax=Comamonas thiooxydans TaxID=363952 RepID=UPI0011871B7F|nr:DUF1643 domain-containing protein [Comamonas thiooxydans]
MSPTVLSQRKLRQMYSAHGHFYELQIPGHGPLKCRRVLELTGHASHVSAEADAIFVMMNPGAATPAQGDGWGLSANRMEQGLVPANPDSTQYQVMRVMHCKGWDLVRVVNLSDLCDPVSTSFMSRYKQLEKLGVTEHSLFSECRAGELERALQRKAGAPIVCAWGVHSGLAMLVARARAALEVEQVVTGVAKDAAKWMFYHPQPRWQSKAIWVWEILQRLELHRD